MANIQAHLTRILNRATEAIADEALNAISLGLVYPDIGDLHPALCREGHIQSLLFAGLRRAGYFTLAEANYYKPASNSRQIDLAVWLPEFAVWLYLEVKPCTPHLGYQSVLDDAQKLIDDRPRDSRDQLRGLLVYGFRWEVSDLDRFPEKYKTMSADLVARGFTQIDSIRLRTLESGDFKYVQTGLWIVNQSLSTSSPGSGGGNPPPE